MIRQDGKAYHGETTSEALVNRATSDVRGTSCLARLVILLRTYLYTFSSILSGIINYTMSSVEQTQTQAIVCRAPQDGERKWSLEKVSFSPPADDEIVVEMVATGICHTDLVCGSVPDEALPLGLPTYPRVLGHEGNIFC